jgi:hypothetical protein
MPERLVDLSGFDSTGHKIAAWVNPMYVAAVEDRSDSFGNKRAYVYLQGAGILVHGKDGEEVVGLLGEGSDG